MQTLSSQHSLTSQATLSLISTNSLIATQADINAKGMYGNSALMKAAYWGMFEVAKYLQCMGADKEQTNDDGLTALHLAAQVGRYPCSL